ncbi:MAG: flavin-dependent monooxygenase, partial [Ilumatobacteraceae bacterium]
MTISITTEDAVARTRELIPELRERAARTAADRAVAAGQRRAMRRAGSLKTLQATRNGGYGLGVRSHLDVTSALGQGCGSTAWVAGVV